MKGQGFKLHGTRWQSCLTGLEMCYCAPVSAVTRSLKLRLPHLWFHYPEHAVWLKQTCVSESEPLLRLMWICIEKMCFIDHLCVREYYILYKMTDWFVIKVSLWKQQTVPNPILALSRHSTYTSCRDWGADCTFLGSLRKSLTDTPGNKFPLEKQKVTFLIKFPAFYNAQTFITMFTKASHWSLWARLILSTSFHPVCIRSILMSPY